MNHLPTAKAWEKVGMVHHHGIQIPLLSIRTEKSSGNGEFLDLIPMIDWTSSLGMDLLQLLPLNDSGEDPSPYNALSATALHPIYLSLHALPHVQNLEAFQPFNQEKRVPYAQVLQAKNLFLKEYYTRHGKEILESAEYQTFLKSHSHLLEYALYKILKEQNNNAKWKDWPETSFSTHKNKKNDQDQISFHLVIQFLCHKQLTEVKNHAEKKGVLLKGDIPILISPDSADVWAHRELFDLSHAAGSPPSIFDPAGQNWKFPLFRWKAIEENHFEWWRKRIETAAHYYHLYRLDHILGFFRLWAIPHGNTPTQGHFEPKEPSLMEAQGRKILETLISFSNILPIGEDLGDPPPFVRKTMQELGIPGTKIFRRYRNWKTDRSFVPYKEYAPMSLSTVSTHDIETIHLWWENSPDEAKDYAAFKGWNYEKKLSVNRHKEILYDNHHSGSLFHVNLFQEYLALTPELTWEDPHDEIINIPGTETPFNWTYRYKLPLETLTQNERLKKAIRSVL
ncbi:MAG: 4-alpha-glucanotransferase [Chlamydiia bacterium]|nr:4-alpha-glucanotransferase [Chlamydiia bacterium]